MLLGQVVLALEIRLGMAEIETGDVAAGHFFAGTDISGVRSNTFLMYHLRAYER